MSHHNWILTGPWYRWPQPGNPASGRVARPVLQKYASTDFVTDFLEEPQRSLLFKEKDWIHKAVAKIKPSKMFSKMLVKSGPKKIFLDTHNRFYVVVCELHCDEAGFPRVKRDKVCEAGFVARRISADLSPQGFKQVEAALEAKAGVEAQIAHIDQQQTEGLAKKGGPKGGIAFQAILGNLEQKKVQLEGQLVQAQAQLQKVALAHNVSFQLQGWKPAEHRGFGSWDTVDATPQDLAGEEVYPLYPLIPDPREEGHSASRSSIWFGVLPVSSVDLDDSGEVRYDDRSLYHVRCFVRRHKEGCPPSPDPGDCKGELVWSKPSENYRLASAMDLDGTSNRPVTVNLPDLNALQAQAAGLKLGEGAGMKMVSPPDSSMQFSADKEGTPSDGKTGGAEICFFAIPLITIVASFVLRLFLPVVVFLFGLWFLLRLKLCIPPSISISADLAVELDVDPGGLEIDASFEAEIDAGFLGLFGSDALNVFNDKTTEQGFSDQEKLDQKGLAVKDGSADFSDEAPADLQPFLDEPPPPFGGAEKGDTSSVLPSLTRDLEYYPILDFPA